MGTAQALPTRRSRPWPTTALCTAAIGLGAGPGFLFGFAGPALQDELGISRGALGLLVGVFFGATGAGSALVARVASAIGARRCLLISLVCVAGVSAAIGAWHSYPVMVAGSVLAGASYAFGNAGTNLAVAAVAPPARRGLALTVKTAGVPLVASLLALGSGLAGRAHWSLVAWALCAASLGTALLTVRMLPLLRGRTRQARREPPLRRGFWLLPTAAFLFICGSTPLQSFLVLYLHDAQRMDSTSAGAAVATIQLVAIAAMIAAAHLADLLGGPRRAAFVAVLCLVAAVGIAMLGGSPLLPVLGLAGAAVGLSGNLATAGLTHAVVVDRQPASVGLATGTTLAGYYLGALVAPLGFGLVVDATGTYAVAWIACAFILCLAAAAYWGAHVAMPVGRTTTSVS